MRRAVLVAGLALAVVAAGVGYALTRASPHYSLWRESVNLDGSVQASTHYSLSATIGQSTPNIISTSKHYRLRAGFQQAPAVGQLTRVRSFWIFHSEDRP